MVLAKRAVNAHKRTKIRVLILTFNITLRNYIHDRISEVRGEIPREDFYIIHYHRFFKIEANNHNLVVDDPLTDCDKTEFFESVKDDLTKYDAIFVDEIQDYKTEWIGIIKKYFLKEGGEFVVFGDEKQNVYRRELANDKKPNTTIPGRWNELNTTFRSPNEMISKLTLKFQDYFLVVLKM